jgi:hypothetical protein
LFGLCGGFQGARLSDSAAHIAPMMEDVRGDIFMRVNDEHWRSLLLRATFPQPGTNPRGSVNSYSTTPQPTSVEEAGGEFFERE